MNKKKLVYINLGGFGDTDVTVLKHLNKVYDLTWFLIDEPNKNVNISKDEAVDYAKENSIKLIVCTRLFRVRSLKNLSFFMNIRNQINKIGPDLIFTCMSEWGWMLQVPMIKCKKIVYGIHDVKMHSYNKSFRLSLAWKLKILTTGLLYKYPCVFSKNQQKLYSDTYHKSIPNLGMSYKNFGSSLLKVSDISNGVKLLFFGSINIYKGLDLLIDAIEELYADGIKNVSLTIAGKGNAWSDCQKRIKHNDLFNLKIRFVDNAEIPDLFSTHHFLVLPYRDATQSGPLLTSLFYGLPIIAPNFGCFSDTYNEESAILYKQGSLKEAIYIASNITVDDYRVKVENCRKIRDTFSEENIAKKYIGYFNELIENK